MVFYIMASPRERMVISTALLIRERGAHSTAISDVLEHSGAPRGSAYHYFPGGRTQLLCEAVDYAAEYTAARVATAESSVAAIDVIVEGFRTQLSASDYRAGCPVVAAAIGSADDDPALTSVAGAIFDRWRSALTRAFVADGFDDADAASLAVTCIASLEGAVVLCRSTRTTDPLREVAKQVEFLIKSREFVHRFGLPSAGH